MNGVLRKLVVAGCAAAVACIGLAAPANAAEPEWEVTFPVGYGCDFPLKIESYGGASGVPNGIEGANGHWTALSAGKGNALTYTNVDTGASFSTESNGSGTKRVEHPDGSVTLVLTGHTVFIMFSSDVGGQSATLYTGQAVIENSAEGVSDIVKESGKKLDICAALS